MYKFLKICSFRWSVWSYHTPVEKLRKIFVPRRWKCFRTAATTSKATALNFCGNCSGFIGQTIENAIRRIKIFFYFWYWKYWRKDSQNANFFVTNLNNHPDFFAIIWGKEIKWENKEKRGRLVLRDKSLFLLVRL